MRWAAYTTFARIKEGASLLITMPVGGVHIPTWPPSDIDLPLHHDTGTVSKMKILSSRVDEIIFSLEGGRRGRLTPHSPDQDFPVGVGGMRGTEWVLRELG